MLIQCVSIAGMPQLDSPSTQGARSRGLDGRRGRGGGCSVPCTYNRGSRLESPWQKCPHLVYCSAVDILKFFTTSSLDLCFVSEVGWDAGDAPGGSRCILGQAIQQSQVLHNLGGTVISGIWVHTGSRDSGGSSRNSDGSASGQRGGIPVLFMLYCD